MRRSLSCLNLLLSPSHAPLCLELFSLAGKKLLENLPNIRQLDTDNPIQAVVDPEDEDSHRELYSGHQLDHQQQVGDGYSQIFDGCSPPEPVEEIKVCIADTGVA